MLSDSSAEQENDDGTKRNTEFVFYDQFQLLQTAHHGRITQGLPSKRDEVYDDKKQELIQKAIREEKELGMIAKDDRS